MVFVKSRNTLVVTAIFLLIAVIVLRILGSLFEENIGRILHSVIGGTSLENMQWFDWANSWINPANWNVGGWGEGIKTWFHTMIDSIFPAVIQLLHTTVLPGSVVLKAESATKANLLAAAAVR